jgi:hypothetical protein
MGMRRSSTYVVGGQLCASHKLDGMMICVLGEPVIHRSNSLICFVQEKNPICGRLLHGLRVKVVPLRPLGSILFVCIPDQTCDVGLLVGTLCR